MMTEWSTTSSTGTSGLIDDARPPSVTIASRIPARSTMAGTPVRSCMSTRSGVKASSWSPAWPWAPAVSAHLARASICAAVTFAPSSWRSRFSSSTLIEYGSRSTPNDASAGASSAKIVRSREPMRRVVRAPKVSGFESAIRPFCRAGSRAGRGRPVASSRGLACRSTSSGAQRATSASSCDVRCATPTRPPPARGGTRRRCGSFPSSPRSARRRRRPGPAAPVRRAAAGTAARPEPAPDPVSDLSLALRERLQPAFDAVEPGADPVVRPSDRGDYQANGVMAIAKRLGRPPRELAEQVVASADLVGLATRRGRRPGLPQPDPRRRLPRRPARRAARRPATRRGPGEHAAPRRARLLAPQRRQGDARRPPALRR